MHEKRQFHRERIDLPVRFRTAAGEVVEAQSRDLSLGGMFVVTAAPAAFAEEVTLLVTFPGASFESRIAATVRWVKPDGMGVQFGRMGARDTHALAKALEPPG